MGLRTFILRSSFAGKNFEFWILNSELACGKINH